jgi:hypothetical protein
MTPLDLTNIGWVAVGPAAYAIGLLFATVLYGWRRFQGLTTPYSRTQELVRLVGIAVLPALAASAAGQRWWIVLAASCGAVLSGWGHNSTPLEVPPKDPGEPRRTAEVGDEPPMVHVNSSGESVGG